MQMVGSWRRVGRLVSVDKRKHILNVLPPIMLQTLQFALEMEHVVAQVDQQLRQVLHRLEKCRDVARGPCVNYIAIS